ncbi:hypothetical protein [Myxosarcina sp. GI1]|nr:hypothetical protein [Myxosarcina sp. GI1]
MVTITIIHLTLLKLVLESLLLLYGNFELVKVGNFWRSPELSSSRFFRYP